MTSSVYAQQPGPPGASQPEDAQEEPIDAPSRSDAFVRGVSQWIGGPFGRHTTGRASRYLVVVQIVIAIACFTVAMNVVEKSDCASGDWVKLSQYRHACYTDVVALYASEGLVDGDVPYRDHAVEYPVLTGALMGIVGLPVHAFAPADQQYAYFYYVTALVLCGLAVASVGVILALRRRRPWDAAMFAVSPALFVTATINWDLLSVAFAMFAMLAWARRRPGLAGALIGLGAAAKLWPVFLLVPIVLLCWRGRRLADAAYAVVMGAVAWAAVNVPVAIAWPHSWWTFFHMNYTRIVDWGTIWYIGAHLPRPGGYGIQPFIWLSDPNNVTVVNWLQYVLFGLALVGIAMLVALAPRRPRIAQIAFLVVAAFLITSKVWSQQYVLWLVPLAVLARPRWGAFLAWQIAELAYFFAFDGELMGASGNQIFPEGVFVIGALLRLVTLIVLCIYVIGDVRHPERDVVRHVYDDDPDGGVLDGAEDRWEAPEPLPEAVPA